MTGVAGAWENPALMMARNAFIQGWESAIKYNAARELSDDEILELADMVLENSDVIGFARAILKKASEK